MDWIQTIGDLWLDTLIWVIRLGVLFAILVRLSPCNAAMFWWKDMRAASTDLVYWFVVPVFLRIAHTLMLGAGLLFLFGGKDPQLFPVKDLPLWQQCLAVQLAQDVLRYWLHRLFHTPLAWPIHAIHHSPKVLDWVSTQRFHPINYLAFMAVDVIILLLGFPPAALVVLTPINIYLSALVHANLNWTFGPFQYVIASPVFHRWHHTTQDAGINKNFASTFPILDVIFGTFYMPAGKLPEEFGNGDPDFPEGFWGQLIYPFRRKKQQLPASPESIPGRQRREAA